MNLLYSIFKDYGFGALQLCVMIFFGWKIMTNHLKHIQDSLNKIELKMDELEKTIAKSNERISCLEGKLS